MNRINSTHIIFILVFLIIIQTACDPGWRYLLIEPPLDSIDFKYFYESDSLDIKVYASDFVHDTSVQLGITTRLDSVIIYPNFSYISSTAYKNKSHAPHIVYVELFSENSRVAKRSYSIEETGEVSYSRLMNYAAWEKGDVHIQVQDRMAEYPRIFQISKEEFLQPLALSRQDSLSIIYEYKSFAIYRKSRWPWRSAKVSGFRFCCDIYNNDRPLEFEFVPK